MPFIDASQFNRRLEVARFLTRLKSDWDARPLRSRSCYTVKEATTLHAVTGAFLHLKKTLALKVPQADYNDCIGDIDLQFARGFLDAELEQTLCSTVPPVDLSQVSFLRILDSSLCCVCDLSFFLFHFSTSSIYFFLGFLLFISPLLFEFFRTFDCRFY